MRFLDRGFWFRGPRPTEGFSPNVWDWFGMAFGLLVAGLLVLTICGVDFLPTPKWVTQSSSTWPLYLTFLVLPIGLLLGYYALVRLLTVGWLRQRINESRHYGLLTLICYWSVGALALKELVDGLLDGRFPTVLILSLLSNDGNSVRWKSQPVTFVFIALSIAGVVIFLFISGAIKHSRRHSRSHRDRIL